MHFRTRSRAFVIVDPLTNKRIAYVSSDLCMGMHMMKLVVIETLQVLPMPALALARALSRFAAVCLAA